MDRMLTHLAMGGHHEQEAFRDLKLLSRAGLMEDTVEESNVVSQPINTLKKMAAAEMNKPGWTALGLAPTKYVVVCSRRHQPATSVAHPKP